MIQVSLPLGWFSHYQDVTNFLREGLEHGQMMAVLQMTSIPVQIPVTKSYFSY
ncbi:unnamed protein product [Larinioides sclopetarius]|uniref:Uncharacterized protein n=1 Tax=Larinioides sclopetarius TaxID=280406 RepID=A0AAV1ZKT8_9ARAC